MKISTKILIFLCVLLLVAAFISSVPILIVYSIFKPFYKSKVRSISDYVIDIFKITDFMSERKKPIDKTNTINN